MVRDVGNLTDNEINSLPGGHNGRLTKMLDQEEAYKTKKYCCLCPIIEYFGISVPFCYYSLLGRVIDFPSRVRVVKKIPSTGRVASTRHSLPVYDKKIFLPVSLLPRNCTCSKSWMVLDHSAF